jgi:hypothetical protein
MSLHNGMETIKLLYSLFAMTFVPKNAYAQSG